MSMATSRNVLAISFGIHGGSIWLNKALTPKLEERWNIPPLATQLAISSGMILGGALVSHKLLKSLGLGAAALTTCARGCSPGSIVCLSETGEMLGVLKDRLLGRREGA